jgi:hypothetical protein
MKDATATADELMTRLGDAASGLLFPSESDYPLTPFRWSPKEAGAEPTPEAILRSEGRDPGTVVESVSAEDFFAPVMEEQEGDATSDAKRYRALLDLLEKELGELRVFRVGSVDIDVLILGRHASGEWIGLRTRLIET